MDRRVKNVYEDEREERKNPAQLEHAAYARDEVYLDASSGIRRPLRKHWTVFHRFPREFFSSAFESSHCTR